MNNLSKWYLRIILIYGLGLIYLLTTRSNSFFLFDSLFSLRGLTIVVFRTFLFISITLLLANFLEKMEQENKKVKTKKNSKPVSVNRNELFDQLREYPELYDLFVEIRQYQSALKKRDYHVGSYINQSMKQLLSLFEEVVYSPAKGSDKAYQVIENIRISLLEIRNGLMTAYESLIDQTRMESEALATTLKNKLKAEGLVSSQFDFKFYELEPAPVRLAFEDERKIGFDPSDRQIALLSEEKGSDNSQMNF